MELLFKNISRYISLLEKERDLISSYWIVKHLERGEHLLEEGSICRYDAFVLEGSLKGYIIDPVSGKEEIIFLAISDWWASDLESFHNQTGSKMNITAISPTTVALISRSSFNELLEKLPKLERYFRIILQNYATALLMRMYFRNAQDAKSRYKAFLMKYPALNAQIPQYLIASYLGISAEMLSKIRAQKDL
ncbi:MULTISPECIES: Crp/Fnr family transcriptional regulator [Niastella]|uniref:Crp/Fnr family transcriptional regulator n=1 Tax=Niastella soli TaxID=2821487 RepID=A0ABS3YQ84_9BACT|nr:Crp/Fnr family transcriptional regulator [Niastella soli]MBO9199406.1 Crp/Fnr family transcriptional regulator [Niastella soli]